MLWILQASEDPSHWVYQLAHGDVLITPMENARAAEPQQVAVLASAKTLQTLKLGVKDQTHDDAQEDPWTHYDPWQGPVAKTSKELSVSQFAAMEANLEQKLATKLRPADTDMSAVDTRVMELEQKVEQLAATVQTNQVHSQQQAQSVQQQLIQLDRKVDGQVGMINATLDAKLSEQMSKIEMLITKRHRTE